jgi:glycosyltransferase involved in cell wall biosynthesis
MSVRSPVWIILTGEYPPQTGGVSDYTQLVARGLAASGDEVHVWAPRTDLPQSTEDGVHVHRLPDHFGLRGLAELNREFDRLPTHARVLVQYVPQSFGWRGLNLPFCVWLWIRRNKHPITAMVHEIASPWVTRGRFLRHNFLSAVHRLMAIVLVQSTHRLYVSILGWEPLLRRYAGSREIEWLPIPSTMPQEINPERVAALRRHLLPHAEDQLVGHFGTFGDLVAGALRQIIPDILESQRQTVILLVGRRGVEFAAEMQKAHPASAGRLIATGGIEPAAVSEHLAVCDLLIQPYDDGISSRRTSAMAGLAIGVPIVTRRGFLTEPIWEESGAVCLASSYQEMAKQVALLLTDEAKRDRLRKSAVRLYQERFHLDRTIAALRSHES